MNSTIAHYTKEAAGCDQCGGDENTADSFTLAPGRWLCRPCMEARSDEELLQLVEKAMRETQLDRANEDANTAGR